MNKLEWPPHARQTRKPPVVPVRPVGKPTTVKSKLVKRVIVKRYHSPTIGKVALSLDEQLRQAILARDRVRLAWLIKKFTGGE